MYLEKKRQAEYMVGDKGVNQLMQGFELMLSGYYNLH